MSAVSCKLTRWGLSILQVGVAGVLHTRVSLQLRQGFSTGDGCSCQAAAVSRLCDGCVTCKAAERWSSALAVRFSLGTAAGGRSVIRITLSTHIPADTPAGRQRVVQQNDILVNGSAIETPAEGRGGCSRMTELSPPFG